MSNKIAFKIYTGSKKGLAQTPKQQPAQQPKKTTVSKPASVAHVNKEEEEKRRILEEQRKALFEKKKKEFEEARAKELDEEGKKKAEVLQNLFKLEVLAKTPEYTSDIMNDRTIRYDSILKIKAVSEICSSWTDVVTLVKYCDNLKYIDNNFDSVLIDYFEGRLLSCIAKIVCQLSELPESMSTGDLRMILGAYPLMITKKPNSTVAEVLFRDGIVKVSNFFKTKTMPVKEVVDGELKIVNKPFNINTKLLKEEDKKKFFESPKSPEIGDNEYEHSDSAE